MLQNDIISLLMFQKKFWTCSHLSLEQEKNNYVVASYHAQKLLTVLPQDILTQRQRIPHFSGEISL